MKNLVAASLVLVALVPHAHAAERIAPDATAPLPPAEYDVPYQGELTIWQFADGQSPCRNPKHFACAMKNALRCYIYIPREDVFRQWRANFAQILRHELGHCNNWPGDHPNAILMLWGAKANMPALPPSTRWLMLAPPVQCITPDRTVENCNNREPATAPQTTTARQ
jgi:hypothetical protein